MLVVNYESDIQMMLPMQ